MKTMRVSAERLLGVRQLMMPVVAAVAMFVALPSAMAWNLRAVVQPTAGAGTVNSASPYITNGLPTTEVHELSASPVGTYAFDYWTAPLGDNFQYAAGSSTTALIRVSSTNGNHVTLYAMFKTTLATYTLTIIKGPGGLSTSPTGTTAYVGVTDKTISAMPTNNPPNNAFTFDQWSGDIGGIADIYANNTTIRIDDNKTITANFKHLWTITQYLRLGPSDLASNVVTVSDGTTTNIAVPATIGVGGTGSLRYRCYGWTNGTGSVLPNGLTASFNVTVTTNSTLAWLWYPQFWVDATNVPQGEARITELASPADGNPNDHWVDSNTYIRVQLVANDSTKFEPDYCLVDGVRQDLSPTYYFDWLVTNTVTLVPVFRASSQSDPDFVAYMRRYGLVAGSVGQRTYDDPDNDGLDNQAEFRLSSTNGTTAYYYNPINPDTDGDGMDDQYETDSVDPTNLVSFGWMSHRPAATDNGSGSTDNGPQGNPDKDYHWSTENGYLQPDASLVNIDEYNGPDGTPPWTNVLLSMTGQVVRTSYVDIYGVTHSYPFAANPVGYRPDIRIRVPMAGDSGDQSKANNSYSYGTVYDDGFKFSWDVWQKDHSLSNEVFLAGVSNGVAVYFTNTIPQWCTFSNETLTFIITNTATTNITTNVLSVVVAHQNGRVFNPGMVSSPGNGPDNDVLYDYKSGRVSAFYYSAVLEYNAWKSDAFSTTVASAPHSIRMDNPPTMPEGMVVKRCSHPFLWDVDKDGLPDGYEVIFGYDPWFAFTPGAVTSDGQANPDGDWMAKDGTNELALRNHEIYLRDGFDPHVAVDLTYPISKTMPGPGTAISPTTEEYSNIEEIRGADGVMAVTPDPASDDATLPYSNDSDGDGIWDGWENYVGLDPNNKLDGRVNADDDKLTALAEFQSFYTSSTNRDALTPLAGWLNKIFPTDPNDPDTDGDGVRDGNEQGIFNGTSATSTNLVIDTSGTITTQVFVSGIWNGKCYTGGGLNPTSADTDMDTLPDPYEASYKTALDGTVGDELMDPDHDGLPNYLEYYSASVYHWQYDVWQINQPSYDSGDFFQGQAYPWDAAYMDPPVLLTYIPLFNPPSPPNDPNPYCYAGCNPGLVDTDMDGMDDYYEIYHGLNPLYGDIDMIVSRAVLNPIYISTPVADPRLKPYINGSPAMDSDGDGLPNSAEYANYMTGDTSPSYHTDPTPLWITDTGYIPGGFTNFGFSTGCTNLGYSNSWVNLYYRPGSVWWWAANPPVYAFDFESNEGYDTDNDGYSDREELNTTQTDPLSPERPLKRRAMYFPAGLKAYARSFPSDVPSRYLQQISRDAMMTTRDSLRSFTVEAWVRPLNPASGEDQVVVERSIMVPIGNPWGVSPGVRLNFRLGINPVGIPYVTYTGDGYEPVFPNPRTAATTPLATTNWTHLCGTYKVPSAVDPAVRGVLSLYVNGRLVGQTNPNELPTIGHFLGNFSTMFTIPGSIVVGAADKHPEALLTGLGKGATDTPAPTNFFKGWIDEVRIWDGARSASEVADGMKRVMRMTDVEANSEPLTKPQLMCLYGFDNLPDPGHSATAPAGLGFDLTGTAIFPPDWVVSFWASEPERSMVYSDYRYVPWIENTVAHRPSVPATDVGDPNALAYLMEGTNAVGLTVPFANSWDPYGWRHYTSVAYQPGEMESGFVHANDLLPLGWAESDEDVPMWDNGTVPATTAFDSDGDGLADDWEERYGLDPLSATNEDGSVGDLDNDGLSNLAEYLAGTNPTLWDTQGRGFADFYAWNSSTYRIFGELYTDHDGMPDDWEALNGLDPRTYDANLDSDGDGWSNLSEYLARTDPQSANDTPQPAMIANVDFNGQSPLGLLTLEVYSKPSMDGKPDARFEQDIQTACEIKNEYLATAHKGTLHYEGRLALAPVVPGTLKITFAKTTSVYWSEVFAGVQSTNDGSWSLALSATNGSTGTISWRTGEWSIDLNPAIMGKGNWSIIDGKAIRADYTSNLQGSPYPFKMSRDWPADGYVREGYNWVFAYIDRNKNHVWDAGEPAGLAQDLPIDVRSEGVEFKVGLTDDLPGYQRLDWSAPSGYLGDYKVAVYNMSQSGQLVWGRTIAAPRTYVQEGDYRLAGVNGLPFGSFQFSVTTEAGVEITNATFETTYYPASAVTPTLVWPVGAEIHSAVNEFVWRMDENATQFQLLIRPGSTSNTPILSVTNTTPFMKADGTYVYRLPIFAGDGAFTNGVYYWQVRGLNPRASSAYSAQGAFSVNLDNHPQGPFSVAGDVCYVGKVTNSSFVVQAYKTAGFGGWPLAQVTVANTPTTNAWPQNRMPYVLKGLPSGACYVRAFLNQNGVDAYGRKALDAWESKGFYSPSDIYVQGAVEVPPNAEDIDVFVLFTDTDNDKLADDWEYRYYTNLTSIAWFSLVSGSTNITAYDAYAASPLNMSPVDPNLHGPDGIPFRIKDAFGLPLRNTVDAYGNSTWTYLSFPITGIDSDGAGHAVIEWPRFGNVGDASAASIEGSGAASLTANGQTIYYQVQCSDDMIVWNDVQSQGSVTYDGTHGGFKYLADANAAPKKYYRYRVFWSP